MSTRRPGGKGPGGKRKDGGRSKAATSGSSEQPSGPASAADGIPTSNGESQVSIMSAVEFNARVARKAFDLFEQRGRHEGHDVEDWLEAERLVKEELLEQTEAQPQ